jgi:hypothetical protein
VTDPATLLGRTRETAIRRDALGRWFDGPDPITHPLVVKSFDGWIERAEDGRYCLKNDINWAYVAIEGPPYFVRSVVLERPSIDGAVLVLSGELRERLDPSTLRENDDGSLSCTVRGGLEARFTSHAMMQLEPLVIESPWGLGLRGDGRIAQIPRQLPG